MWHEINVGEKSAWAASQGRLHSAVLSVPAMLTKEECETLMAAADANLASAEPTPRLRVQLADMKSERSKQIFDRLLRTRTFDFLEKQVPEVARSCFGQETGLAEMQCAFNSVEPSINVYTTGGDFKAHQDSQHLTLLVNLSAEGAFTGGGTAFWRHARTAEFLCRGVEGIAPDVVIKPTQGDALYWNGDMVHAGCTVESGKRHILVGSFSLTSPVPAPVLPSGPRVRVRGKDFV